MKTASTQPTPALRCRLYWLRLGAPLLWAVTILWLSLSAAPPQIHGPLGWDKLLHAGAYALLSLLVGLALQARGVDLRTLTLAAATVAILYGGLMELLQWAQHAGRSAEWLDLAADACGAVFGCVIFRQAGRFSWFQPPHRNETHG